MGKMIVLKKSSILSFRLRFEMCMESTYLLHGRLHVKEIRY